MIWHIIWRELEHIFSAMGLVVGVFFALRSTQRHWAKNWLPSNIGGQLLLSGFGVFGAVATREAFDVARGDPLFKSPIDNAAWLVGIGLGIWAAYRLIWLKWEDR